MVTICPLYDGSVRISWYPVMLVLNTISPEVSPSAPKEYPSNTMPSANASIAFFISALPIRNAVCVSEPVPNFAVTVHDFCMHFVPVNGHVNKVKKSAVLFPVIDRSAATAGDDMHDIVKDPSLVIMFVSREHRIHLELRKERLKAVPAIRILVEAVVSMVPLPQIGVQG